jgi:hypothetical protein
MPLNKDLSFRSFGTSTLLHLKPESISGTTIRGSGWSFEQPLQKVFPDGTKSVTFESCRLDNVVLPPGSVLDDNCSNYQYQVGEDGKDWVCEVTTDAKTQKVTLTPKALIGGVAALPYKRPLASAVEEAVR